MATNAGSSGARRARASSSALADSGVRGGQSSKETNPRLPIRSATEELPEGDLRHAVELVALARELGFPCVGVAVHPEGHPAATSRAADLAHQAAKLREADFALTQFFHRADDYFALVDELRRRGATAPVVPGVMPITSVRQVERMAAMSGSSIPLALSRRLQAVAHDP